MLNTHWQVWIKQDGTVSVPREATFDDLCRMADAILDHAARAPKHSLTARKRRWVVTVEEA